MAKKKSIQRVQISKEVDGLELGVFDDGTPFLSMRSLARLCGAPVSALSATASSWLAGEPATTKLGRFLIQSNLVLLDESLYQRVSSPNGTLYAFADHVCQLVIEFFAFEAKNDAAIEAYRITSRAGLKIFIYSKVGYKLDAELPMHWRQHHDRELIVSAPPDFFSVFKESNEFTLHAIRVGFPVDHLTIPDISIGRAWGEVWVKRNLADQYGARQRFPHYYPDYFPQAKSNPQEMWVYPLDALPEFRRWLETDYAKVKYRNYLRDKVKARAFTPELANKMLIQVGAKPLELLLLKGKQKGWK